MLRWRRPNGVVCNIVWRKLDINLHFPYCPQSQANAAQTLGGCIEKKNAKEAQLMANNQNIETRCLLLRSGLARFRRISINSLLDIHLCPSRPESGTLQCFCCCCCCWLLCWWNPQNVLRACFVCLMLQNVAGNGRWIRKTRPPELPHKMWRVLHDVVSGVVVVSDRLALLIICGDCTAAISSNFT